MYTVDRREIRSRGCEQQLCDTFRVKELVSISTAEQRRGGRTGGRANVIRAKKFRNGFDREM